MVTVIREEKFQLTKGRSAEYKINAGDGIVTICGYRKKKRSLYAKTDKVGIGGYNFMRMTPYHQ